MQFTFPPYIEGIFYSFIFLLATGPSFFYLISLSMKKGFESGVLFAFGIIASDIFIVSIIYYGLGSLLETNMFKLVFNCIGGVILFVLGIRFILDNSENENNNNLLENGTKGFENCLKGFLMNITNPFAFFVWLTLHATLSQTHPEFRKLDFLLFFVGLFASITVMEVSKAFLANKIGGIITSSLLVKLHKLLGLFFVAAGCKLIFSFVQIFKNDFL